MSIDEGSYGILREADERIGTKYCDNIHWYQEENFIGQINTIHLLDMIYDLTKEIDGLHELVKELNSKEDTNEIFRSSDC